MIIRKRNGSEAEFKKSNIVNAISSDEDMEKLEPSCAAGGNI